MNAIELRKFFAEACLDYIGCNEADGSHKPIIDLYNSIRPLPVSYKMSYSDAWCAAFISAVAAECALTEIIFPECSCDRMIALYKKAGRWIEDDAYKPRTGDIVFYDWNDSGNGDNTGGSDHVGVVYAVNGTELRVVEGNKGDAVAVRTIYTNGRYIRGYGIPDYDGITEEETVIVLPEDANADTPGSVYTVNVRLPVLQYGDKGQEVKAMQILLDGRGYDCGWLGADGNFGGGTKRALLAFQTARGLEADAVCGIKTWNRLLFG